MNSHVIPEFIYSPLYDEKHRLHVFSKSSVRDPAMLQKGIREQLLCIECEGKLSEHERYMSQILSGDLEVKVSRTEKLVILEGLNYKQFRLFGLSVLWRASVSSHHMFEKVKLGPHEELLRRMILSGDAGKPERYPFVLVIIIHENQVQGDLIVEPIKTRSNGHYAYIFVFGGLAWVFLVSKHKPPSVIANVAISEEGKTIMLINSLKQIPFIINFMHELARNGRFP